MLIAANLNAPPLADTGPTASLALLFHGFEECAGPQRTEGPLTLTMRKGLSLIGIHLS